MSKRLWLCVTLVVVVGLGVFYLPSIIQSACGGQMTSEEMQHWAHDAVGEEAHLEILKGWQNYGDGLNKWLLLRVPTGSVEGLKARIAMDAKRRQGFERLDDADEMPLGGNPGGSTSPLWWHPDALGDPDVLHVRLHGGGYWFVFSRNSGLVYVYTWSY